MIFQSFSQLGMQICRNLTKSYIDTIQYIRLSSHRLNRSMTPQEKLTHIPASISHSNIKFTIKRKMNCFYNKAAYSILEITSHVVGMSPDR